MAALSCSGTTVSLAISWLATSMYDLTDVQLGLSAGVRPGLPAPRFTPFLSQTTSSKTSLLIEDLPPGTSFAVALRHRASTGDHLWTDITDPVVCSTLALAPMQPLVLPPTTPPTPEGVTTTIRVGQARDKSLVDVQYRRLGDLTWLHAKTSASLEARLASDVVVRVAGLSPGLSYQVRARVAFVNGTLQGGGRQWGPASDEVVFRTADAGLAAPLEVYRVTEHCGTTCHPDFLHNHNAGDLLADVSFITAMSDPKAKPNPFIQSFEIVAVTKYCVARRAERFTDYVSCNGPNPETSECACNNYIDRCIGRQDKGVAGFGSAACNVGGGAGAGGGANDTSGMPLCSCSPASSEASKRTVGSMPVYFPYPKELDVRDALTGGYVYACIDVYV